MSPTAVNMPGHHDSFSLPSANANGNGHANSNGNGHVDARPVHATAKRGPEGGSVRVEAAGVRYEQDGIKAEFTDRGASVTRELKNSVRGRPELMLFQARRMASTRSSRPRRSMNSSPSPKSVESGEHSFPCAGVHALTRSRSLLLVGLGGNNGTTVLATHLANKHQISWNTKHGIQEPNYIGSLVRASTIRLGTDPENGKDVFVPVSDMLPMVHPNDFVIGGWDISGMPMDQAMSRAEVLPWDLQRQLKPLMEGIKPMPSIYCKLFSSLTVAIAHADPSDPDFIAANQEDRADNLIAGDDKGQHLEQIRADIRNFKSVNDLDKLIVLWTANTERYAEIIPGINDTADNLLSAIKASHDEVSPSTVFAVASILEGVPFLNGSPQNTFVPGCIELAEMHKSFIGGDDFKSGQTKVKSVLAEFLVNAGIKPLSIASYNHLGNNDGKNLSSQRQFRSKEISKSSVVRLLHHIQSK